MNPFTETLIITPSFSKRLFRLIILVSLAAMITVISLPIHFLLKLLVCVTIIVSSVYSLREHCWHMGKAIKSATLRKDHQWFLTFDNKGEVKSDLVPGCLVLPWLTVLVFKTSKYRRRSLILLRDNVNSDQFRRLRVRLKNVH